MNLEDRVALGKKIKEFRKRKGLTQAELAEGIVHESAISHIERGAHTTSGENLKKICDRLGITTSELLEDHTDTLDASALIDLAKIHLLRGELESAHDMIQALKQRNNLTLLQHQEFCICESDYFYKQNQSAEAINILSRLKSDLEKEREVNKHLLATVLNKLGNAYYITSQFIEAYPYYLAAYDICTHHLPFDMLAADVCFNMGNVCRRLGKDREGLGYMEKAKAFYEDASDLNACADVLFAMGISSRNLQNIPQAASYLKQSLHLYETQNFLYMAEEVRYAYAYLVASESDPEQAIEDLLESARQLEQIGNVVSQTYTYALTAATYLEQRDLTNTKIYLDLAFELFSEDMMRTEKKLVFVYYIYSKYLLAVGDYTNLMIVKQVFERLGDYKQASIISDHIIANLQNTLDQRSL